MGVIPGAEARGTAAETFRRLYWDTALSWGAPVLRMLRDIVGIDRVVSGSDYPYRRRGERTAILGGTAAKLIPRLASLLPLPS